ncbi:transglutaminase family protein [Pseudoalteromonas sp. DY56-GL79]|uniref:transglutaminase-like domain-containing protein n=1 Tax=Pseudoalteromonas sp. DY56-GL79 TaxID=2967131 RepID=UPI00352B7E74
MKQFLVTTPLVDYQHSAIQSLIEAKGWQQLDTITAAEQIYNFVKDDIEFGYSETDTLTASQVLKQGYGQCNTKGTLLVALLRACDIPTRVHGFEIANDLKQGLIPTLLTWFAPKSIIHSWIEVYLEERWVELEGYIIDDGYLKQVQQQFSMAKNFTGFGISTPCLQQPDNRFSLNGAYIQKQSITRDLGFYTSPDALYQQHKNLTGIKQWLYAHCFRHWINQRVRRVRAGRFN